MRVTFIGHACCLIEVAGLAILSDPWWRGPCFGAQWWVHPAPHVDAVRAAKIDYIYISHGHHDHLHPATLSEFGKDTKVLVSAGGGLASSIRELGFEVIEVPDGEPVSLGEGRVACRIMQTHGDDTLMTVTDGVEVCVNLNDALHSAPAEVQQRFIATLKRLHPRIDYVFCGYGVASHFPNCYLVPGKDREATAARRQRHFNCQWAGLIDGLAPRFGFPFAADVVFLEDDLFWANEVTHNAERPTDAFHRLFPASPVLTHDIAPGFAIEDGRIVSEVLRKPLVAAELRHVCAAQIERANRYGTASDEAVCELLGLVRDRVGAMADELASYPGDYRMLLRLRNARLGLAIRKEGQRLQVDAVRSDSKAGFALVYTTRLSYLKRALTQPYGDEILFVGSGGVFEYAERADASRNLHRELMAMIRGDGSSRPRHAPPSPLVGGLKRVAKRLLGRVDVDLYDLRVWTVFTR